MTVVAAMPSVDTLVSGLVDYAGLFPPAGLDLVTAARNYGSYRTDEHCRLLGRFIIPAAQLDEFHGAAAKALPRRRTDEPWRLSVLVGPDIAADLARITLFNNAYAKGPSGRAVVDAVEGKAATAAEVEALATATPRTFELFIEIPIEPDPAPLLGAIARRGARAKVRTGGVTPDAIPSTTALARFMADAVRARVAFKATAGLHHPVRSAHPLTYAADSPRAVMHGFFNVFLAAAFLGTGATESDAVGVLEETDPVAFRFAPGGLRWHDHHLTTTDLRTTREQIARAFGSCSFREPVDDLRALHLL
ncbi:MAG: hypothetical protein ACHQTF_09510 [Gemmatimonadales bacterium]